MRMVYLTRANRAKVYEVNSGKTLIEREGLHRIPDTCVYTNVSGRDDSLCIMQQGRVLPYGDMQSKATIEMTCSEIIGTHFLGGRVSIDSTLDQILSWVGKNGVTILLILIGLTILISTVMEAT